MPKRVRTNWQRCTTSVPVLGHYKVEFIDYEATVPDEVAEYLLGINSANFTIVEDKCLTGEDKVLIRRDEGLGDVLLVTPTIRALYKSGVKRIHFMTFHHNLPLFDGNPYIEKLWKWDDTPHNDYTRDVNLRHWVEKLEQRNINKHRAVQFGKSVDVDITSKNWHLDYFMKDEEVEWAERELFDRVDLSQRADINKRRGRHVAMVWQASADNRSLSLSKKRGLVNLLVSKGYRVVLLHGLHVNPGISSPFVFNACGRYKIRESIALLNACDVVIAPDSGLFHVAQALDKPTVTYFGAFDYKDRATSIKPLTVLTNGPDEGVLCQPCRQYHCMRKIDGTAECINIDDNRILSAIMDYTRGK